MIDSEQLKQNVVKAVEEIRATNPMAGSITNTVTIDFVANAQLAVGGSAAMVYLPDEGEALVAGGGAIYLNMGTLFPIYEQTIPRAAKAAHDAGKPWCSIRWAWHRQPAHPTGKRTQAVQTRHRARQCLRDYRARRPVGP